jgi:hypothetical protein
LQLLLLLVQMGGDQRIVRRAVYAFHARFLLLLQDLVNQSLAGNQGGGLVATNQSSVVQESRWRERHGEPFLRRGAHATAAAVNVVVVAVDPVL